jgi:hypothetical protein
MSRGFISKAMVGHDSAAVHTLMFPWAVRPCKKLQKQYRSCEMAKDLDRNEWYFGECPTDEVDYCWTYEYARESEILRKLVMEWRQNAKGNKLEDYQALPDEIATEPLGLCVYPFFPCWPNTPYLSIAPKTRKEWLNRLGMPLPESYFTGGPTYEIQARNWSKESTRSMLERFAEGRSLSFRHGSIQYVVFNLDWNLHDKELATLFLHWLKQNRPKDAKAFEMRGRGNPVRQGQAKLKDLSIFRVLRNMSRDDAVAFLEDEGSKLKPYKNYQDWDLAVDRVKATISRLEAGTF